MRQKTPLASLARAESADITKQSGNASYLLRIVERRLVHRILADPFKELVGLGDPSQVEQ